LNSVIYFFKNLKTQVRDRWVELEQKNHSVYDASDIPAGLFFVNLNLEWHMWLNHIRDEPPLEKELITTQDLKRRVVGEHLRNFTGERDKRYSPTGHFLNLEHQNPQNSHRIETFDPNSLKK
jgi:NADH:ubiquinone oxidoreductase subunit